MSVMFTTLQAVPSTSEKVQREMEELSNLGAWMFTILETGGKKGVLFFAADSSQIVIASVEQKYTNHLIMMTCVLLKEATQIANMIWENKELLEFCDFKLLFLHCVLQIQLRSEVNMP